MALAIALSGCGQVKESLEDVRQVQRALKTELGVTSNVTVNFGTKGTVVAVHLTRLPPGEAAEVKRKVAEIVARNFRARVRRVDVTF